MPRFIALLRGINVGGKNKIPMADLCALCRKLGWGDVRHYIQSGNVVFAASGKTAAHEAALEKAITDRFGLAISVVIRSAKQWVEHIDGNPFPDAAAKEPNRVMLALSKSPPREDAAAALRERAVDGERIESVGNAIWVHFPSGQARTKLSPALMDRLVGSCVTMRNWTTVLKINDLLKE